MPAAIAATAIASASAVAMTAANAAQAPGTARAATPAPHWRIVAAFPKQSFIDDLAASGPASAWAVESCRKPCASGNGVILRHWNGKAWQAEPQPANAKHTGSAEPLLATAPGSRVAWAVYDIYDHKTRASVAEWTGKSWAHPTVFPVGTNFQGLAAPGPSDLWAFGSSAEFGPTYVARFNGKSWAQAPSPGPSVGPWTPAARSASDIWVQAITSQGLTLAVSRWNGTRWVKQAVPPAPKGAQGGTGGLSGDLVVSGQHDVWGYGYFALKATTATDWLLHWNGKAWSNVRVPYTLNESYMAGPLGPDGHGGAWFEAVPAGASRAYLYHVSAAGQWTRVAIPTLKGATGTEISGFAAIPGTSSVYAYGWAADGAGQRGVILKYGA
jgi:hypothetical protein